MRSQNEFELLIATLKNHNRFKNKKPELFLCEKASLHFPCHDP